MLHPNLTLVIIPDTLSLASFRFPAPRLVIPVLCGRKVP